MGSLMIETSRLMPLEAPLKALAFADLMVAYIISDLCFLFIFTDSCNWRKTFHLLFAIVGTNYVEQLYPMIAHCSGFKFELEKDSSLDHFNVFVLGLN